MMAIVRTYIDVKAPIPQEVIEEVEVAAQMPVVPDEECSEFSDEQIVKLAEMRKNRHSKQR